MREEDAPTVRSPVSAKPMMDWIHRFTWLFAFAATAVGMLTIWVPPLLPCADLPGHQLAASVHLNPEAFQGLLVPNWPPTALGFVLPVVWIGRFVSVELASRWVFTLYLMASCVGFAGVARVLRSSVPLGVVAGVFVCLGWSWAMGFANYVAGLSLGSIAVWCWLESRNRVALRLLAAVLFWGCAVCHVPAAVVMVAWGLWVHWGCHGTLRTIRSTWVAVPLVAQVGYSQWCHVRDSTGLQTGRHGDWEFLPFWERVTALWRLSVDVWSPLAPWVVGLSALAAAIHVFRTRGSAGPMDIVELEASRARRVVLAGMVLGVFVFLALPLSIPDWSYLSPRVLPPIMVSGLLTLPSRSLRGAVPGLVLALAALVSTSLTYVGVHREGVRLAAMVDREALPAPGRVYSMVFGMDSPYRLPTYVVPARGLAAYAMASGGAGRGIWANFPAKDSILFASPAETLFPQTLGFSEVSVRCAGSESCAPVALGADLVARDALAWDSLFVAGAPAEFGGLLTSRGYRQVHPNLWLPTASNVVVGLEQPPEDVAGNLRVVVLWPQTGVVVGTSNREMQHISRNGGAIRIRFSVASGDALVFAFIDNDGNEQATEGEWGWAPQAVVVQPGQELVINLGVGAPVTR